MPSWSVRIDDINPAQGEVAWTFARNGLPPTPSGKRLIFPSSADALSWIESAEDDLEAMLLKIILLRARRLGINLNTLGGKIIRITLDVSNSIEVI